MPVMTMAYLRGNYYLWSDGDERLHVWAFDGGDPWMDSGWASDADGRRLPNRQNASGVSIPETVMDEFVMMRFAQLIDSGAAAATIDRALRHGDVGGEALAQRAESIKRAIRNFETSGG
jgi:hypothetical protein